MEEYLGRLIVHNEDDSYMMSQPPLDQLDNWIYPRNDGHT